MGARGSLRPSAFENFVLFEHQIEKKARFQGYLVT
jgi:hypothetical protein